jgi:hypothetical protein
MKAVMDMSVEKSWRDDAITFKQRKTIIKMQHILGWTCTIPDKKGPAADRIKELMSEAERRISVTGSMGYKSDFDGYGMFESDQDDVRDHMDDIFSIY